MKIGKDGARLDVFSPSGKLMFSLEPPDGGIFYLIQEHALYGPCPIVSFEDPVDQWPDWFYLVDIKDQVLKRLNPWK